MRFSADDCAALEALLRAVARAEVMPRFRHLPPGAVRSKSGPLDLVTDADIAAEAMIAEALQRRFPGCVVVGEEGAARDPAWQARMASPGLVFVVDPIDGTNNYAAGLPLFGTMAAAVVDGVVAGSCIHDPVTADSCVALAGGGAWGIDAAGARRMLSVCPPAPIGRMTGTLSWRFLPAPLRASAARGASALAGAWDFRCAAHHYRLLVEGQSHFSVYNRLLPWDHAPGWLLHREAGGYSARFDGSAYDPRDSSGGLICAPDEAGWTALRDLLVR